MCFPCGFHTCTPLKLPAHTVLFKGLSGDWKSKENSVQWSGHSIHNSSCYTEIWAEFSEHCVTLHATCILWDNFFSTPDEEKKLKAEQAVRFCIYSRKNYITEAKLFVVHFHGQVTSLWFLFIVLQLWFHLPTGNGKPKEHLPFISVAQN